MENAINCVALFYKVGFSIRDFSRKKRGILTLNYSESDLGKLCFYSFFNLNMIQYGFKISSPQRENLVYLKIQ